MARLVPVEPAMIVGPRAAPFASASISASISSAPRRARSIRPRSASQAGHWREGDLEKVEGDAPVGIEGVGDETVEPLAGRRPR